MGILVTGGAGFIGSHLCEKLVRNNKVVIYDNWHRDALRYTNLAGLSNITIVKKDILDTGALRQAAKGCHTIIHLAAIAGVNAVAREPLDVMRVNLFGTKSVLDAIDTDAVLVNFSSSEVYGPDARYAHEDGLTVQKPSPRWVYATSKIAAEHLVRCYPIKSVMVRPFNVYGPRQVGDGAVHHFVKRALNNEPLIVHDMGRQVRAWCFIDDFIKGVLLVIETANFTGPIFNIGNPYEPISVFDLARRIIELSGSRSTIEFDTSRTPEVLLRVPSIKKITQIGYKPTTSLDEGLMQTIDWYRRCDS